MYLLQTLKMMDTALDDPLMTDTIKRICDTICHTAPEILDSRWNNIYIFCSQNVQDGSNPKHKQCYEIYQKRLMGYKECTL